MSKRLALALRHRPEAFGLTLDAEGWVPVADVLAGLRMTRADVDAVLAQPGKRRYEVDGDRIRARYGHSVETPVEHPAAVPPDVLFHGTTAAAAILAEGLRPMGRQYVHLAADAETARIVGARRRGEVVVLAVDAAAAHAAGIAFRPAGDGVWLADAVPAGFIRMTPGA